MNILKMTSRQRVNFGLLLGSALLITFLILVVCMPCNEGLKEISNAFIAIGAGLLSASFIGSIEINRNAEEYNISAFGGFAVLLLFLLIKPVNLFSCKSELVIQFKAKNDLHSENFNKEINGKHVFLVITTKGMRSLEGNIKNNIVSFRGFSSDYLNEKFNIQFDENCLWKLDSVDQEYIVSDRPVKVILKKKGT